MTKKELERLLHLLTKLQTKTSFDGSILAPRVDDAGKLVDMVFRAVGTDRTVPAINELHRAVTAAYEFSFHPIHRIRRSKGGE